VRARRAGGHLHGPRPRSTGLLPQELEAAPPLATQLEALAAWVAGDVLVVHVAAVDLAFLDAALRHGMATLGQLRRVAGV
jgi:DNA polymerase III epsilon subunit-like protein